MIQTLNRPKMQLPITSPTFIAFLLLCPLQHLAPRPSAGAAKKHLPSQFIPPRGLNVANAAATLDSAMRRPQLLFLLLLLTSAPEFRCQHQPTGTESKPVYSRPFLGQFEQQQQFWDNFGNSEQRQRQWTAQRPAFISSESHRQMPPSSWQHFYWPQPDQQQAAATMPWEFGPPRKGLQRLLEEFASGNGEGANGQQPQLSPDMNRPPLATNLERYMPLLAKQRPKARNATAGKGHRQLIDSREMPPMEAWRPTVGAEEAEDEEDESLEEANGNGSPAEQQQPCVTANCRTWITITIPSELVGIPPGIGLPASPSPQQKPDSSAAKPLPLPNAKPMPPFPPVPMPNGRSRGLPSPKNRPASSTAAPSQGSSSPTSAAPSPTTSAYPPDFVFSTKWILPVNGVSLRPTNASSVATTPPPVTTATAGPSGGGNPWGQRPFTMRPRAKQLPSPSPIGTSSVAPPDPLPVPRERPPIAAKAGTRPGKPWTHTASAQKAKERPAGTSREKERETMPRPPTPDTTIEQAAIWASTELIDAIREALAKFRASLNRNAQMAAAQDEAGEEQAEAERMLHAQLQTAWDSLRGTWLEQAVAELAQQADALGGGGHQRRMTKMEVDSSSRHNNDQQQQPTVIAANGGNWQRRGKRQQRPQLPPGPVK